MNRARISVRLGLGLGAFALASIAHASDEGEKRDGRPKPSPRAVEERAVVDQVFGSGAGESQYSSRLTELIEEAENGKAGVVFPAEPTGLVTSGLNRKVSGEVTFPLNEVALAVSGAEPRRIAVGANATTDAGLRQSL